MGLESERSIGEVRSEGNPWVVAVVMEKAEMRSVVTADDVCRRLAPADIESSRKPMTLEA